MIPIFITLMAIAIAISTTALIVLARFLRRYRKNEEMLMAYEEMSEKLHKTIARHQELRERLVGVDELSGSGTPSKPESLVPRQFTAEQLN